MVVVVVVIFHMGNFFCINNLIQNLKCKTNSNNFVWTTSKKITHVAWTRVINSKPNEYN